MALPPDSGSVRGPATALAGLWLLGLASCGGGAGAAPEAPGPTGDGGVVVGQPAPPWTWAELLQVESDRVRLMPLGDSITVGIGAAGGYRLPLFVQFQLEAFPRLEFVGSQSTNWPAGVPLTKHEGHSGWSIDDLLGFAGDEKTPPSSIETLLEAANPSIVLLHAGTNDTFEFATWQESIGRLETLLDRIGQWDPTCSVIVAQLIPTGDPSVNLCIDWLNRRIEDSVAARSQAGAPLQLVDMSVACPTFKSGDGSLLHPDLFCYIAMAQAWRKGMERLGEPVLPPEPRPPVLAPLAATASSFVGNYLPDFAVTGVGLEGDLHRAELDQPLGWRSEPYLQVPGPDGGGVADGIPPSFTLRLSGVSDVQEIELWNGRVIDPHGSDPLSVENVRRLAVETSADGVTWTVQEALPLAAAPVRGLAPPETFGVEWPGVRFVRLTVSETHGEINAPGGILRSAALAEVRLRGQLAP